MDLPKDQLSVLSPWRQLKIYCAGIWHNLVLVGIALLLLFGNPFFLKPFYIENAGVTVTSIVQESGAYGPGGLLIGDHIIAIDGCIVTDPVSWKSCLARAVTDPQHGYCQKKSLVQSEGSWFSTDCCHGQSKSSVCFNYVEGVEKVSIVLSI